MKASALTLPVIALFCIFGIQNCEVLKGEDECEGSAMDPVERLIQLRATFSSMSPEIAPATFLKSSEELIISGSIQKEYCSGKLSGHFTYNPSFFPLEMAASDWEKGLIFPQSYQYKFSNKEDELILIMRFKAYTTDGRIYESGEFVGRYKYAQINYDVNKLRYYILIYVPGNLQWFRVTS